MIRFLVLALALIPMPVFADPLGLVDYDAVIAANIDDAEDMQSGNLLIRLPHEVELIVDPDGALVHARDRTGALGCLLSELAELSAMARICPGVVGPGQADGLDTAIGALFPVYAAGVLPDPASVQTVADGFEALVQSRAQDTGLCDGAADNVFVLHLVNSVTGRGWLQETLAAPRLPVSSPCF